MTRKSAWHSFGVRCEEMLKRFARRAFAMFFAFAMFSPYWLSDSFRNRNLTKRYSKALESAEFFGSLRLPALARPAHC